MSLNKDQLTSEEHLDLVLNKTALDFFVYGAIGYSVGLGLSIFFKRSKGMVGAGLGCGYGFGINRKNFNSWSSMASNSQ